ncbi:MAG: biotin/lipoyl-containing protein [Bacteroidales bacterium]|nr:biotin/lipoyl-containing protein [Bacteroidales bacterium]
MRNFKFNIRGNNYEVDILKLEGNQAEIEVNGTMYCIEIERKRIESKTPILVRSAMPNSNISASEVKMTSAEKSVLSQITAPLPGNIMQIFVKPGDKVKRGDKLIIYEAMKMENNLIAEKDGIVKSIKINVGDSVSQGDLLIEME